MSFYELAEKREDYFLREIVRRAAEEKDERYVLVTGGFHKEGLAERFKREGISYIEITPRIKVGEKTRENYVNLMLGRQSVKGSTIANILHLIPADVQEEMGAFLEERAAEIVRAVVKLGREAGKSGREILESIASGRLARSNRLIFHQVTGGYEVHLGQAGNSLRDRVGRPLFVKASTEGEFLAAAALGQERRVFRQFINELSASIEEFGRTGNGDVLRSLRGQLVQRGFLSSGQINLAQRTIAERLIESKYRGFPQQTYQDDKSLLDFADDVVKKARAGNLQLTEPQLHGLESILSRRGPGRFMSGETRQTVRGILHDAVVRNVKRKTWGFVVDQARALRRSLDDEQELRKQIAVLLQWEERGAIHASDREYWSLASYASEGIQSGERSVAADLVMRLYQRALAQEVLKKIEAIDPVALLDHGIKGEASSLGDDAALGEDLAAELLQDDFYRALAQGMEAFISLDGDGDPAMFAGGKYFTHFGDQEWGRDFGISTLGLSAMAMHEEIIHFAEQGERSAQDMAKGLIKRWAGVDKEGRTRIDTDSADGLIMYNVINWYGSDNKNQTLLFITL